MCHARTNLVVVDQVFPFVVVSPQRVGAFCESGQLDGIDIVVVIDILSYPFYGVCSIGLRMQHVCMPCEIL